MTVGKGTTTNLELLNALFKTLLRRVAYRLLRHNGLFCQGYGHQRHTPNNRRGNRQCGAASGRTAHHSKVVGENGTCPDLRVRCRGEEELRVHLRLQTTPALSISSRDLAYASHVSASQFSDCPTLPTRRPWTWDRHSSAWLALTANPLRPRWS